MTDVKNTEWAELAQRITERETEIREAVDRGIANRYMGRGNWPELTPMERAAIHTAVERLIGFDDNGDLQLAESYAEQRMLGHAVRCHDS